MKRLSSGGSKAFVIICATVAMTSSVRTNAFSAAQDTDTTIPGAQLYATTPLEERTA